jgi:hypothetical protein
MDWKAGARAGLFPFWESAVRHPLPSFENPYFHHVRKISAQDIEPEGVRGKVVLVKDLAGLFVSGWR